MKRYRYRRLHGWSSLVALLVILLVWYGQGQSWFGPLTHAQHGTYRIDHFIDGDTIAVDMNGTVTDVRFIGVDTPETHKPDTPVQCYGPEAAAFTARTIGSQRVRLVSDSLSTDRDRYNRLLRYVYLPDGRNLNELLVQQGYGFYYPYFAFSMDSRFAADEHQAMAAHRGLWSACKPTPSDDGGFKMNEPEPKQR
ncbi:MAG TPA: thermonuclease family protein [Candidatus Saccharimonadales bacterium]|nr:thermonuclease family protein [Candidatus Saccharimonadales bacterium]